MALSYNLAYQEIILVHPTRRQIFAAITDSTFWNIWQWVIYKSLFSTKNFGLCPQIALWAHSLVTLIALQLLLNEFFGVSSKHSTKQMHSCNGCIYMISPHSFNSQMYHQITCLNRSIVILITFIWFLQSEFSNVSSNGLLEQMHSGIVCICTTFRLSDFSNVSSNGQLE